MINNKYNIDDKVIFFNDKDIEEGIVEKISFEKNKIYYHLKDINRTEGSYKSNPTIEEYQIIGKTRKCLFGYFLLNYKAVLRYKRIYSSLVKFNKSFEIRSKKIKEQRRKEEENNLLIITREIRHLLQKEKIIYKD